MFKLESYITPILFSYVSRYINNFKPEDSQVSLWGGDATFHNLELNLQALEQELQLPFSFVSGSIRELLIHVPWTKITSEPITITINTIECILNLKGKDSGSTRSDHSPQAREKNKKGTSHGKDLEPPQGYVQLLINKIVSNIRICCNNVILKYVEEDIVLSMNIKLLKFESANNKWEPAYSELSQPEVVLRKLITVNDLTLCLDKRNASGKIEVYQEPMLYRCSMRMHVLRQYHSATIHRNSLTRFDIYCNKMEFSMTEQQVPMLMRLLKLLYALHQKQLKQKNGTVGESSGACTDNKDNRENAESWAGWAWSYVSSVLPAPWEDDWQQDEHNNPVGHTLHTGFYVETATITFKISETWSERSGYYPQTKTRYNPLLCLSLQGIYAENIMHGLKWFNAAGGISEAVLLPKGACSCSCHEVSDDNAPHYLKIGSLTNFYKSDSLFDAEAVENKGKKRLYNNSWDYHLTVYSESVLLERTPAFAYDYLYQMEVPSDASSDILSDLGSDYEYSNLSEKSSLRICLGPLRLRLCSGFFHRMATLKVAGSYYDYPPYYTLHPDPALHELPPASEEDFDALVEFIPSRSIKITIFAPIIELELMDHPYFQPVKGHLCNKRKKSNLCQTSCTFSAVTLPKLSIECQFLDISIDYPMYVNRLVQTTCQLPDPPPELFGACFTIKNFKVVGICTRLVISPTSHTIILTPSSVSYNSKSILKPQYWINPNIPHNEITFESEGLTLNATNAKMMVIAYIIMKTIRMDSEGAVNMMNKTTILADASKDEDLPYMELCIEEIRFKQVTTISTVSIDMSLGSIKGFIFEPVEKLTKSTAGKSSKSRDLQQVLFLSGPEPKSNDTVSPHSKILTEQQPLLTVTVQYPVRPDLQNHPPILLFNLQEIRICIDPLLCRWLLYSPKKLLDTKFELQESLIYKHKTVSEVSDSIAETPRKVSSQLESVHSSSDREILKLPHKLQIPTIEEDVDLQEKIYNFLKKWFEVWKGVFLYGDMSQCTIYFPLESLSAIGSQGIQEAVESAVNKEHPPDIMVITLPFANIRSTHRQSITKYLKTLPITLPNTIWSPDKSSFPWTVSISDLSCYTIQYGNKLTFLKPVSLSATVGLSTRIKSDGSIDSANQTIDIGHLGVCVHIDMTPILISTSEVQIYLFASIIHGLVEVSSNLFPDEPKLPLKSPDIQLPLVKGSSTLSPTLVKELTFDSTSEKTPPDVSTSTLQNIDDNFKLTAWVQWTITRFTIELLSNELKTVNDEELDSLQPRLKLVVDAEDIVSSLDFQSVYLKIKSKVGSASIQHYKRSTPSSKWKPGAFSGVVMRLREDISLGQHHEDSGFISVTITRASCQHTHTLWGAVQRKNKERKKSDLVNHPMLSQSRYITEIVVNIQPIDFVISLKTLRSFYLVIVPLLEIPVNREPKSVSTKMLTTLNNQVLPLAYLDCQDIRVIVPSADLSGIGAAHDVFIFQIHKITINPSAVNPICRNPLRSDIYEQAAHARILSIPGSEVEDRQYQLDLIGISVSTGIWEDVDYLFTHTGNSLSSLRGTSENPALEWNNLERGQPNVTPILNLWHVTDKFDVSVIAAPAMVYKESTLVCGHSIEVNFVSDILVNLSLSQIKLLSSLLGEFMLLIEPLTFEEGISKRPKFKHPYSILDSNSVPGAIANSEKILDSGIETSDLRSVRSSKQVKSLTESDRPVYSRLPSSLMTSYTVIVPVEVLFTAGKIALGLYEVDGVKPAVVVKMKNKKKKLQKAIDDEAGYEAEEENFDSNDGNNKYSALVYFCLKQPNIFMSKDHLGQRVQISCFDLSLKLSGPEYQALNHIPTEEDFPVNLLETRSGVPDANTGILPAFFTMKFSKVIGKSSTLDIEVSKPTKIRSSLTKWSYLLTVKDKVLEAFKCTQKNLVVVSKSIQKTPEALESISTGHSMSRTNEAYTRYRNLKELLSGINSIGLNLHQIIFSIKTDSGQEVNLGIEKMENQLTLSSRPERLGLNCSLRCVTVTMVKDDVKRLILNPWSVSTNVSLFWESWQSSESEPQIHIIAESDCLIVDISPEQIKAVEMVVKDVKEFIAILPFGGDDSYGSIPVEMLRKKSNTEKDQHYKDDLRAGAFQFVNAGSAENTDNLPLPYQVMFWNDPQISAMVWRYPQPRALTKVKVFPVPYKTSSFQEDVTVSCELEYWSEIRNCYLPFAHFKLSESEMCHLKLPEHNPKPVVASAWRVSITTQQDDSEDTSNDVAISPRALAACMRIDSYFNRSLIPRVTAAIYATKIEIALHNSFEKTVDLVMPDCLKNYTPDFLYPESQRFLAFIIENLAAHVSHWEHEYFSLDISSAAKCSVLDYEFLTEQSLIETFSWRAELAIADSLKCNVIMKPIEIKFGPSIGHALAVATQVWFKTKDVENNFIIMTRYVICNDTNVHIRFGQTDTDEDILLASRHFHSYSWRSQKKKQQLKVAVEENDWIWSKSFRVLEDGVQTIAFSSEKNMVMLVSVRSLSATQKVITISGQLIISNMLMEHFELKVVEAVRENRETEFKNTPSHIVPGRSRTASIFINNKKHYHLRLRFYGLESAWTGDIPLREHANVSQPWLVKVPLQERGQFLSIWCRIVIQDFQKVKKVLAMLWPLFSVKSNLPIPSKVHIETPTLNVHLDSVVNGRGELQQLYCPGTIDHSHQLTFKIDKSDSKSNPYVPLNYSLVDHQTFFKKSNKEDIDNILDVLSHCYETKWPYFDEELNGIDWIIEEQPLTHVQVKYQNACQYSSSLLVELLPWCLTVNTLGVPISFMLNGTELCRIQHHGIIAPPKFEENFSVGVCTAGVWRYSGPLQLAKSDWSQSFYMPKITGNIPLEGTIKTAVSFDAHVCMLSITSKIANEIRLLKISSTHVLSNHLQTQIQVVCIAVPDVEEMFNFPKTVDNYCFTVPPHQQQSHAGISVIQWHTLKHDKESSSDYALYMSFSLDPRSGWSCPVRVDKPFLRKPICLLGKDEPLATVLTSYQHKGQTYVAVHRDDRPQLLIENKTDVGMFCGQSLGVAGIAAETQHFRWHCKLPRMGSIFYTMPLLKDKFPELPQNNYAEKVTLAVDSESHYIDFKWSPEISIIHDNELFVRIPHYGDVKVIIVNMACTTFLTIESASQAEISARDIRVRLSMHQSELAERVSEPLTTSHPKTSREDLLNRTLSDSSLPYRSRGTSPEKHLKTVERRWSEANVSGLSSNTKSMMISTLPIKRKWKYIEINAFLKALSIVFVTDMENEGQERWELASFVCDNIGCKALQDEELKIRITASDVQIDNQLYSKESFDFPVVMIGQEKKKEKKLVSLNVSIESLFEDADENALVSIEFILETWRSQKDSHPVTGVKSVKVTVNPISCYIEDTYITKIMDYLKILMPNKLVLWPTGKSTTKLKIPPGCVWVPDLISWQCALVAQPLTIRYLAIAPLSLLLSVHSSVKLYIALDQSPLQFGRFERRRLFTTHYRLGHALTMHYLSGAIFGAGWVVSSLELIGSPGGLARAMGTGLRDFVSMPYRGLVVGPMAFLKGITQGSASLMRHITAGTLQSVTKLASSVARNLDRLTLDEEHMKRTEELRRHRPQGLAQGFIQGLTGLGISLLGAVGGIAHHPLQSVMADGASPRSLVTGVGLGLVGMVTKPLSGAAELVALTGQGLLQGAGWNSLPEPRSSPTIYKTELFVNSALKYNWKHTSTILPNQFLLVTEATSITTDYEFDAVTLILTLDALIIINNEDDHPQRVISISEVNVTHGNDPTILTFKLSPPPIKPKPSEADGVMEMDPISRARVADYVKNTVGHLNLPDSVPSEAHSGISISPLSTPDLDESANRVSTILTFFVNPQSRNYFLCLLALAKHQHQNYNFSVL